VNAHVKHFLNNEFLHHFSSQNGRKIDKAVIRDEDKRHERRKETEA